MKKRVCIIGNSHVAALKLGWESVSESHPDIEITMFAAPGKNIAQIVFQDGEIVPTSDYTRDYFSKLGGAETVALSQYDALVVVGSRIQIDRFLGIMLAYRPLKYLARQDSSAASRRPDSSGERQSKAARQSMLQSLLGLFGTRKPSGAGTDRKPTRGKKQHARQPELVSGAVFREIVHSSFRNTIAGKIIMGAARQPHLKIYYVSSPFPSSEILGSQKGKIFCHFLSKERPEEVREIYWTLLDDFLAPTATLIRQAAETLERSILTKAGYSRGSTKLANADETHADDELRHMNRDYGEAMMKAILEALEREPPEPREG